ncbi:endonuclease/exonuclease/phosphatase family protein [Hydrogenimonas cancrithermarum]|uniref:endonuclease/exonuclease/phosphatase family protein n=1 Tax=Hydrogenimonas cancrithermarum TaxID=2993563 RepID=UPI002574086A|nr:endonuclease/exonuclease/phosphatase family protein [Hydrogenimonas cancrithermarum]
MKTLILLLLLPLFLFSKEFRVASYNVENLFDLQKSGSEYTEYIPNTGYGWNKKAFTIKVDNIARVICDLKLEIIGLQEIESDEALEALQAGVKRCGWPMAYRAIADEKATTVKTALLSKYPILQKREIDPDGTLSTRNILEVLLDVDGKRVRIFVNHWKSRSGAESRRIVSAKALMRRLMKLSKDADYILLGDFNSDWNEWRTIKRSPRLNDTDGITGINHILKTIKNDKPVSKYDIGWPYHYDLWLELPPQRRWSHNFYGLKSALDHMILPAGMFDTKGINYKDRSFKVFKPNYLFTEKGAVFRWQIAKKRHGKHLNAGYSDHLPIYAHFTTEPFVFLKKRKKAETMERSGDIAPRTVHIADLYTMPLGWTNAVIPDAAVIYKKGGVAILKEPGGRAILVYKDTRRLKKGHRCKVAVRKLYDYRGLREVTKLDLLKDFGKTDVEPLLLDDFDDLNRPDYVNEVVREISGTYKRGYLYYGNGKKIKLYYRKRKARPKSGENVTLKRVRVALYRNRPELVVD